MPDCTHIPSDPVTVQPLTDGCQDCLEIGSTWLHLRMCQSCGHVGCCDQSTHRHARAHFLAHDDHPLLRSLEPDEAWWYCWIDDVGFELEGIGPLRTS